MNDPVLIRASIRRDTTTVQVAEDGTGRLWLIDLEGDRRTGAVLIGHDVVGEVHLETIDTWFVGGRLPAGTTGVRLGDRVVADWSVGTGAWIAALRNPGGEIGMTAEFLGELGEVVETKSFTLPAVSVGSSSRRGVAGAVRSALRGKRRGGTQYQPP